MAGRCFHLGAFSRTWTRTHRSPVRTLPADYALLYGWTDVMDQCHRNFACKESGDKSGWTRGRVSAGRYLPGCRTSRARSSTLRISYCCLPRYGLGKYRLGRFQFVTNPSTRRWARSCNSRRMANEKTRSNHLTRNFVTGVFRTNSPGCYASLMVDCHSRNLVWLFKRDLPAKSNKGVS